MAGHRAREGKEGRARSGPGPTRPAPGEMMAELWIGEVGGVVAGSGCLRGRLAEEEGGGEGRRKAGIGGGGGRPSLKLGTGDHGRSGEGEGETNEGFILLRGTCNSG